MKLLRIAPFLPLILAGCDVQFGVNAPSFKAHAKKEQHLELEINPGELFRIESDSGAIEIDVLSDAKPHVRAEIDLAAPTEEIARLHLEKLEVKAEAAPGAPAVRSVRITGGPIEIEHEGRRVRLSPTVRYWASVPPGTLVHAASGSGDITLRGSLGAAKAKSDFGKVVVQGARGPVEAGTASGDVEVKDSEGDAVSASTKFGRVVLSGVSAKSVKAESSSGNVELQKVRADKVSVESSFGKLTLEEVDARSVEAKTASGDVTATPVGSGEWTVRSDFGRLKVRGGSGTLRAVTKSGNVDVESFQGAVTADSGFGDVTLSGTFDKVAAASKSGRISVKALAGSRAAKEWSLRTEFGGVDLEIADDFACRLAAETEFGEVKSELAAEAEAQRGKPRRELSLPVNGGGEKVELHSKSGDIRLRRLRG